MQASILVCVCFAVLKSTQAPSQNPTVKNHMVLGLVSQQTIRLCHGGQSIRYIWNFNTLELQYQSVEGLHLVDK